MRKLITDSECIYGSKHSSRMTIGKGIHELYSKLTPLTSLHVLTLDHIIKDKQNYFDLSRKSLASLILAAR